jgi:hypothetical protein
MALTLLSDFPDRLSPMLVKELRQGMRARSFTLLFLIFQGLLAFILLVAGASFENDLAGSFASGVIFTLFSIAVLVIQPMRAANALSAEITGNTIEMMVLTRLSAWRIVFGKWIAIVSQSALILTSIIPYLILRYFLGGMVLVGELVFLCLIFLTSMALTAVIVGLSATAAKLARALPLLGIFVLLGGLPSFLFRGMSSGLGMSYFTFASTEAWIGVAAYLGFIGYLGWCALSFGTASIAPVSENHATLRRIIALVLAGIAVGLAYLPGMEPETLMLIFEVILAPALIVALTEPAIPLPPLLAPFLKRGLLGRHASLFLLPGWPSGVNFSIGLIALSIAGMALSFLGAGYSDFHQTAIPYLALLGGILLPALLSAVFSKQETKRFSNFLIFLIGAVVISVGAMILTSTLTGVGSLLWLFIWNPLVALYMGSSSHYNLELVTVALMIVDGTLLLLLWLTAARAMKRHRGVMESSETILAVNPATPS